MWFPYHEQVKEQFRPSSIPSETETVHVATRGPPSKQHTNEPRDSGFVRSSSHQEEPIRVSSREPKIPFSAGNEVDDRVSCSICGRKFNADRIDKHIEVRSFPDSFIVRSSQRMGFNFVLEKRITYIPGFDLFSRFPSFSFLCRYVQNRHRRSQERLTIPHLSECKHWKVETRVEVSVHHRVSLKEAPRERKMENPNQRNPPSHRSFLCQRRRFQSGNCKEINFARQ